MDISSELGLLGAWIEAQVAYRWTGLSIAVVHDQEIVWSRFPYLHQLLFGAIIVAVVLMMPRGILGVLQQKYNLPRTI